MNEMFKDFPDMLTVQQLQDALCIGRTLAYRLLRTGAIQSVRLGNNYRIPKKNLIESMTNWK